MTTPRPTSRRVPLRAWMVVAMLGCASACASEGGVRLLAIQRVTTRCARAGDTLTITLANVAPSLCAAAKVALGDRLIENLGQTRGSPLTLQARLPQGFEPPPDAELLVVCETGPAAQATIPACPGSD